MENLLITTCDTNNSVLKTLWMYLNTGDVNLKPQIMDLIVTQMAQNAHTSETVLSTINIKEVA